MNENIQARLETLKIDYNRVRGHPFTYFYCPILFKDEDVPICKGHIINLAFPNSARDWVVQRQDVDKFYGSNFESDFVAIQDSANHTLGDVITDKSLSKKFGPKILLDDKPVDFFIARDDIPKQFTRIDFDNDGRVVRFAIKMHPDDFLASLGKKWEIAIEKDVRISAVVSLIKSAHLTLFGLLGYNYALSTAGYFVGRDILGMFFQQNYNKSKSEVQVNAYDFFREFAPMVRPIQSSGLDYQGTITDKLMLICKEKDGYPWAFIVFIKTSQSLHCVMIPIFEQPDAVAKFMRFLKDENEFIEVNLARFEEDHWNINKESSKLHWPKTGILYP
jgi:hypothetical protein